MILQEPMTSLNPVLTIGHQIGETLRLHRAMSEDAARKRSLELLARVGIVEPEKRALAKRRMWPASTAIASSTAKSCNSFHRTCSICPAAICAANSVSRSPTPSIPGSVNC